MEEKPSSDIRQMISIVGIVCCGLILAWSVLMYRNICIIRDVAAGSIGIPVAIHYAMLAILLIVTLCWTFSDKAQKYFFGNAPRIVLTILFYLLTWLASIIVLANVFVGIVNHMG